MNTLSLSLADALQLAIQHHQAGDLTVAIAIYQQILAAVPNHQDAMQLLGVACYQNGDSAAAVRWLQQSLALNHHQPAVYNNLGLAFWDLRQLDEAVAAFYQALHLQPDYVEAAINLGGILQQRGENQAACSALAVLALRAESAPLWAVYGQSCRNAGNLPAALDALHQACRLEPESVEHWRIRAIVERESGLETQAYQTLQQALQIWPQHPELILESAATLAEQKPDEARVLFRQVLAQDDCNVEAWFGLGCLAQQAKDYPQAERHFLAALAIAPHFGAFLNLGNLYGDLRRPAEAMQAYQQALLLQPDSGIAMNNAATLHKDQGNLTEAIRLYCHALELQPDFPEAQKNLGTALRDSGHGRAGLTQIERAMASRPSEDVFEQSALFTLNYLDDCSAEQVFQAHCAFNRHAPLALEPIQTRTRIPLRVGYVSGDFRAHSVAYFIDAVLRRHDPQQFQTYAYATAPTGDATTNRLRRHFAHWRDVVALDDAALARQIRNDEIDILIDLAGHTGHNRWRVFALRPAPLQVAWLGYPNTTGLAAIDYRLTDAVADPAGFERLSSEQLWRLPHSYFCYQPDANAPGVAPPPALKRSWVTLGCANVRAKLSPSVLSVWAEVMADLPQTRLLLKTKAFGDSQVQQQMRDFFTTYGIAEDRLEFRGYLAEARDHLAVYHDIDLALDSYPYNGATTTCEALWMGVPVITWAGDRPQARMGASILTAAGLPQLIAQNRQSYRALIAGYAADPLALAKLRMGMRERLRTSPLLDAEQFARNFEQALQAMWRAKIAAV